MINRPLRPIDPASSRNPKPPPSGGGVFTLTSCQKPMHPTAVTLNVRLKVTAISSFAPMLLVRVETDDSIDFALFDRGNTKKSGSTIIQPHDGKMPN
jgi:hypothetical protein